MNDSAAGPAEFHDPLEDYEPKKFDDPLEQALVDEEIGNIRHEPFTVVSPETPVHEAVEKLANRHIACVLVTDDRKLVGVFSERDVLHRVALEYGTIKQRPIKEFMTTQPVFAYETDSAIAALTVMSMFGHRHVPILDLNDNLIGIVSPQRLTEFLQNHFAE